MFTELQKAARKLKGGHFMKKSVKKVLAAVLALALIALGFSACGGKEGGDSK